LRVYVLSRLHELAEAAGRIADGDLSTRADASRAAGEISALIQDFNRMADALETSDRELQASAAAIAHELRTPLTILRGRLQGMVDGVFHGGGETLNGLILQVDHLSRIVDDLQTVSLAATGALTLRPVAIDLAAEIEAASALMAAEFAAANMRIDLDLRPADVVADPARVRQAALALMTNARTHAAEGGAVRIETARDGANAVLRVHDRGRGLSDGDKTKAFERFWRSDAVDAPVQPGQGLGLSVVQAIARAHGGAARVFDREGGGATFELSLPAVRAASHAATNRSATPLLQ
jgi:two-component system sensor histidine kinase AdeS